MNDYLLLKDRIKEVGVLPILLNALSIIAIGLMLGVK